jgi:SAM-dependent methyltransferase
MTPSPDRPRGEVATAPNDAWQLRMFRKTLKKQQKVDLLLRLLDHCARSRCLLITGGDNNGAMNHVFRGSGGHWTWAEMEEGSIPQMEALLGERVLQASRERVPFADGAFDRVVVIDVHEHMEVTDAFNRELTRVLAPGGRAVVTTPNGALWLPVALLKRIVGMGPAEYGHVVQGYTFTELESMMRSNGLTPVARGAYSRFFTEIVELALNFAYVKILSRPKKGPAVAKGTIAPSNEEQLASVEKTYRMYSLIYPLVRAFSALDVLVPGKGGYAVAVVAVKEA